MRRKSGRKENELGESLHSFRGTCLSSLPGMIEDVKVSRDTPNLLRSSADLRRSCTGIRKQGSDRERGCFCSSQFSHAQCKFEAFLPFDETSILTKVISSAPRTQVVNFARQLADNQSVVETFLNVLGAGNWGGPKSSAPSKDDGENGLLPRYLSKLDISLEIKGEPDMTFRFRRRSPHDPPHFPRLSLSATAR